VVEGTLPEEIDGAWYCSVPDPQFPPMLGDDTYLSGDGMVSLFRIHGGRVDFKQRYVQTERWRNERAAASNPLVWAQMVDGGEPQRQTRGLAAAGLQ